MWLELFEKFLRCAVLKLNQRGGVYLCMFTLPPGLLTGGFYFANMWSVGEFRHMVQGGFFVWTMIVINNFFSNEGMIRIVRSVCIPQCASGCVGQLRELICG